MTRHSSGLTSFANTIEVEDERLPGLLFFDLALHSPSARGGKRGGIVYGAGSRGYVFDMSARARNRLREIGEMTSLVRTRISAADPRERDGAGYRLLARFAGWAQPGYVATKSGKSWFADAGLPRRAYMEATIGVAALVPPRTRQPESW